MAIHFSIVLELKFGGFPCGLDDKQSACNAGEPGLIPGSGRSPGEGNGDPLQYSCLESSMEEEPGGLQSMGLQSPAPLSDTQLRLKHFNVLTGSRAGLKSNQLTPEPCPLYYIVQ